jgi:phospholipid/cholesterol/gamma-HCH transport system substrate-binding protein
MDRDANYVAVGAFVVVVLAMATVFVLWYTNTQERREYQRYEVYFSGSVSGLTEGSTVRYLGVNVGRVARIRLDPRTADRVQALIDVDKATPVTHDTLARLTMQGVTGLLFIDLYHSAQSAAASAAVPSQQYPVIRSARSDFDLFVSGLPELVADATRATRRLNTLLGDDNLSGIQAAIANVRTATGSLPAAVRDTARLVTELRAAVEEANTVAVGANRIVSRAGPELGTAAVQLRETSGHLASLSGRIDALIARHEPDFDRFAGEGLNELHGLLRESRDAAAEVRELARGLREEPSRVLYQQPASGMEIPR